MKINKTILYIHNLEQMINFYGEKLGFPILEKSPKGFQIAVGNSILAFELISPTIYKQYHFAFNIPSNLFDLAKGWIQKYTPLLTNQGEDEVFFQNINAHSLYFYDPEENVVEFIARHDINPKVEVDTFSVHTIIDIGEMNLTTDDLMYVGKQLITIDIPVRNNEKLDETSLNFMGEADDGVHLLLGPSKRNWFFSTKDAIVSPIVIEINDNIKLGIDINGHFKWEKI